MDDDVVIYTDGHGIKVTTLQFIVGRTAFFVNGIRNVQMLTIRANRDAGFIFIITGLGALALGLLRIISPQATIRIDGTTFSPNDIASICGIIILMMGILWSLVVKDKYAVRIMTAEGVKDAVVSHNREYITQIVNALVKAAND